MNFIKINNSFINLRHAREINVVPTLISNRLNGSIRQPTHEVKVEYADRITSIPIFAEGRSTEDISGALYDAIANCADADCEDINDYIDEDEDDWDEEDDWDDD